MRVPCHEQSRRSGTDPGFGPGGGPTSMKEINSPEKSVRTAQIGEGDLLSLGQREDFPKFYKL